jgi:alanine racemase
MTEVRTCRAQAQIDLRAIEHNISHIRELTQVPVMVVVKADAYGHGAVAVAHAAKSAGAEWLGVAFVDEAIELRNQGVPGPILAWLLGDDDFSEALEQAIDLSIVSVEQLEKVATVAREIGMRSRVHIEVDTGLSRAGASATDWRELFELAVSLHDDVEIISIWSHLACADEPEHPANLAQQKLYESSLALARECGLNFEFRHIANSAGALAHPQLRYDMVRCGIATYGVTPGEQLGTAEELGLEPVMTLTSEIAHVRRLNIGDGVSYSHRWTASTPTTVGLIPLGYADGIPRAATNKGWVTFKGEQYPIVGTVCMDQFVVDFGDTQIAVGDTVTLFGRDTTSAHEWARVAGSIGYELVTRLGERVERVYKDGVR